MNRTLTDEQRESVRIPKALLHQLASDYLDLAEKHLDAGEPWTGAYYRDDSVAIANDVLADLDDCQKESSP